MVWSDTSQLFQAIAILFGAFVLISKIALEYPTLLHKKKKFGPHKMAKLIAHRGSRTEGLPENTIAAFKDAIAAGADVLELDVWLSTDGKVVVHHDTHFDRMTAGASSKAVVDCEHHSVPEIDPPEKQRERCHLVRDPSEWQRIPLLHEVLQLVDNSTTPLNVIIEFKHGSDELISKVEEIIHTHKCADKVLWFSLIDEINRKLKKCHPTRPNIASVPQMLKILALYYIGVLPFVDINVDVVGLTIDEIPLSRLQNEAALKGLPPIAYRLLAYLFRGVPPAPMLAPKLFRHLRARGIAVWFMNVNTEAEVKIAAAAGASGVLTDRINWLTALVREQSISFAHVA